MEEADSDPDVADYTHTDRGRIPRSFLRGVLRTALARALHARVRRGGGVITTSRRVVEAVHKVHHPGHYNTASVRMGRKFTFPPFGRNH